MRDQGVTRKTFVEGFIFLRMYKDNCRRHRHQKKIDKASKRNLISIKKKLTSINKKFERFSLTIITNIITITITFSITIAVIFSITITITIFWPSNLVLMLVYFFDAGAPRFKCFFKTSFFLTLSFFFDASAVQAWGSVVQWAEGVWLLGFRALHLGV